MPNIVPCAHAWTGQKGGVGSAGPISVFVRMHREVSKNVVGSAGLIYVLVRMRG
jgi:hypothetical protein